MLKIEMFLLLLIMIFDFAIIFNLSRFKKVDEIENFNTLDIEKMEIK